MSYIILGIIQGLTEFLPISSSGHLVIFQALLRVPFDLVFDTVVHLATALAVMIYFWREIIEVFTTKRKMLWLLLVGTFFTGIIGLLFEDYFKPLFSSVTAVGGFLILTGVVILLGEAIGKGERKLEDMNFWDAMLIGLAQGAAIAPGLSRSGTTISTSLARNLERKTAAEFSFLLAIPAILGAGLVQAKDIIRAGAIDLNFWPLFSGFVAAFFSGLIAIRFFMGIIQRVKMKGFAYYCFVVGSLVLILGLMSKGI